MLVTEEILGDVKRRLQAAIATRRHAMHAPVVVDETGDARIMVLRGVDDGLATLRFHTDARSPKAALFARGAAATVLAYDPDERVQLRMKGVARIERAGPMADAAWAATSTMGRRCYLAEHAPGVPVAAPGATLPQALGQRRPTLEESEAGRTNFAVLLVSVLEIDWLQLDSRGGTRAVLRRAGLDAPWQGGWVSP